MCCTFCTCSAITCRIITITRAPDTSADRRATPPALTPSRRLRTLPAMHRRLFALGLLVISMLLASAGCDSSSPHPRSQTDAALFGPAAMRIHPIFTQVKDWTGDGKPDGIEALIELQDQFGDPTKASGRIVFELYEYRAYD